MNPSYPHPCRDARVGFRTNAEAEESVWKGLKLQSLAALGCCGSGLDCIEQSTCPNLSEPIISACCGLHPIKVFLSVLSPRENRVSTPRTRTRLMLRRQ